MTTQRISAVILIAVFTSIPTSGNLVLWTKVPGGQVVENCEPKHVHISFGDEVVHMKIMFATKDECSCEVLYGIHPWSLDKNASSKYEHFVLNNWFGLHHLHMADLHNLSANKRYYYRPQCGNQSTGVFSFHVPPTKGDSVSDYLVFGDMGVQTDAIDGVIKEAESGRYTALIHNGDFGYNLEDLGGQVGDLFMQMIEPVASILPYMTCPGNHEINRNSFAHYRYRFAMPGTEWPIPLDKMWYSLDIGLVHFVSYSTEVFFTNNERFVDVQRQWLLQDLEKANNRRHITPWVVAFGHRPLYCSTKIGDDCSLKPSKVRNGFEQIFHGMRVDLVLQSHEHNYERLWPLYLDKVTQRSYHNSSVPIQIITGAAGSGGATDHFDEGFQPEWSAFRLGQQAISSYGRMKVLNRTHIWWEQRWAKNHTRFDGIWITKDDMYPPPPTTRAPSTSFRTTTASFTQSSTVGSTTLSTKCHTVRHTACEIMMSCLCLCWVVAILL